MPSSQGLLLLVPKEVSSLQIRRLKGIKKCINCQSYTSRNASQMFKTHHPYSNWSLLNRNSFFQISLAPVQHKFITSYKDNLKGLSRTDDTLLT